MIGVAVSLLGQPATTYSWMWQEAKDTGHEFVIGLLDITESSFGSEWKVVKGGNQSIDLSKMIPGDERLLEATLSKGASDLDFVYKIVAQMKNTNAPEVAQKLEEVLHIRIASGKNILYEGLVRDLHPQEPGVVRSNDTENMFHAGDPNKKFLITAYLPQEGVDHTFQALQGELELRFLAKQVTQDAIYAE
ncbi:MULTISPECIES: hypothetical protein [Brevibacillus]|uniref:hypothetical protein n=1 Tax=Brevibacillus TaxID=55080 RepID=UPI000F083E36|nr:MULTISPECIES: hypothetical protein [Brevibacillus]MDH4617828.1 hypothetical protein [Brevibacillus sp. AY1]